MKASAVKISNKNEIEVKELATPQNNTIEFISSENIEYPFELTLEQQIEKIKKAQEQIKNGETKTHQEIYDRFFAKYKK
ncbi:MAG: hypothetical protein LBQ34_06525 [Alphaproteobacteria bacterium]|jgi:predicted transcriptional regulator|nr:hypothetical protein [Alphaproteobacteria bacterium]